MPTTDRVTAIMRDVLQRLPMSVSALARQVGISQPMLWRILNGDRRATPAKVAKIADALASWGKDATAAAKALRRAIRKDRGTR
jgi:transcriptional regulator with XRE-family HTH domain